MQEGEEENEKVKEAMDAWIPETVQGMGIYRRRRRWKKRRIEPRNRTSLVERSQRGGESPGILETWLFIPRRGGERMNERVKEGEGKMGERDR